MNESTHQLSIRIKFSNPSIPRQGSDGKYRWDRILLVATALTLMIVLAFKMTMSSPPEAKKVAEPVSLLSAATAAYPPAMPVPLPVPERVTLPLPVSDGAMDAALLVDTRETQSPAQGSVSSASASASAIVSVTESQAKQVAMSAPDPARGAALVTAGQTRVLSEAVQRLVLTNAVVANEPVGGLDEIGRDTSNGGAVKLFAYSQVRHLAGEKLIYRWLRGTTVAANVEVKVGSDNWRSHASKNLSQEMRGHWRVELRTGKGELLAFSEFEY